MRSTLFGVFLALATTFATVNAQSTVICGETGSSPWMNSSYVFGRVRLADRDPAAKFPRVVVTLSIPQGSDHRFTIDRSGGYCFRGVNGSGGTLVVTIEGIEVGRRSLPGGGPRQFQEDFEISTLQVAGRTPGGPAVVVATYPRNEKNAATFARAVAAEDAKKLDLATSLFGEIVADDPADYISWFRLGSIYFAANQMVKAEASFLKAVEARPDHVPSLVNLGRAKLVKNDAAGAIEVLTKATKSNPSSPRVFQLLGEAYVVARDGGRAFDSLQEAIRLDPVGMAECHLLLAHLYDMGGAKSHASKEYRLFLEKIPDHPDKKKFEKYIRENPPARD